MPAIQIKLTEEENKIVDLYRLKHNLKDKRDAIRHMIRQFEVKFEVELKEEKKEWKWKRN